MEVSRLMENINQSVAIAGFPGVGKTTLKLQLEEQYPDQHFRFVELPGVVMLGRNTPAEEHTYDFLLGRSIDIEDSPPYGIIALVDAAEINRQFYLIFQLIDLRLPLLLCITGELEAAAKGLSIDIERLSSTIGVSIVSLPSESARVVEVLKDWKEMDIDKIKRQPSHWRPSAALADAYQHLDSKWIHKHLRLYKGARLVEGLRLLTVPKAVEEYEGHPAYKSSLRNLDEARNMLTDRNGNWTTAEVIQRSNWIGQTLETVVTKTEIEKSSGSIWWRSLFKSR